MVKVPVLSLGKVMWPHSSEDCIDRDMVGGHHTQ